MDAVYMAFIQAATGGGVSTVLGSNFFVGRFCSNTLTHNMIYAGGWPMTVFITPNGRKPFTGGTYFPEARFAAILEKCVCRSTPSDNDNDIM